MRGAAEAEAAGNLAVRPPAPGVARVPAAVPAAEQEFSVVGTRQPYIDGYERLNGAFMYTVDVYLPGTLYGKILRSPHPNARVVSIDTSKAEALEGVRAVITFKDVPQVPTPAPFHYVLNDRVHIMGDEIAAVAAVSEDVAEDALELIEVEYEVLPFVFDVEEAMKPGAPLVHDGTESNFVFPEPAVIPRGDVEAGFAEADKIVEGRYRTALLQHVALEPHAAAARWEADGSLTMWVGSQHVHSTRDGMAAVLGMPQEKVRVICQGTGGGFGDKTAGYSYMFVAALLAKKAGRPVRVELTREEVFLSASHGYAGIIEIKTGVKNDGTLTALDFTAIADNGAYSFGAGFGFPFSLDIISPARMLYNVANARFTGIDVYTNTGTSGFKRSVGEPAGNFALEAHMDKTAEAIGMDPLEFRLKNVIQPPNSIDLDFGGLPHTSNGILECLQKGAEAIGWPQNWGGWGAAGSGSGHVKRGFGMAALACNKGGQSPPMSAQVKVNSDGSVRVIVAWNDVGAGQFTTAAMIAAEALGARLEDVSVAIPDTAYTTDAGFTAGSRATKSIGPAVIAAAEDARQQLLVAAASILGVEAEVLSSRDSKIFVTDDPSKSVTLAEAASKGGYALLEGALVPAGIPILGRGSVPAPSGWAQATWAAGFAEVEVDTETGQVKVLRLAQAHDVGRAINPMALENQIVGGAIQGIGIALMEDQHYDPPTGLVVTPNILDYRMMSHKDVHQITPIIVEPIDAIGPYGAKGIGEPAIDVAAPAIANAVYNAIGVRIDSVPITPDKVLAALG
jgi:CO/xanthine dehydrogenase Mo-binding subunit